MAGRKAERAPRAVPGVLTGDMDGGETANAHLELWRQRRAAVLHSALFLCLQNAGEDGHGTKRRLQWEHMCSDSGRGQRANEGTGQSGEEWL